MEGLVKHGLCKDWVHVSKLWFSLLLCVHRFSLKPDVPDHCMYPLWCNGSDDAPKEGALQLVVPNFPLLWQVLLDARDLIGGFPVVLDGELGPVVNLDVLDVVGNERLLVASVDLLQESQSAVVVLGQEKFLKRKR